MRRSLRKLFIAGGTAVTCILISACSTPLYSPFYYGFLPGGNYKFFKPRSESDLSNRCFEVKVVDARNSRTNISCSNNLLDRKTELEGRKGLELFEQYALSILNQSKAIVAPSCSDKLEMSLEGLSFQLIGMGYVAAHGLVQFRMMIGDFEKTYCADMTDQDADSPIRSFSFHTRRNASRLIVSGAIRRSIEQMLADLNTENPGK